MEMYMTRLLEVPYSRYFKKALLTRRVRVLPVLKVIIQKIL